MAKSVGKFTGVGYRPLQGDIATDILNAEDQEFAHRAEDRLVADRTKAQVDADAAKKKAADEAYAKNLEKVYIKPTGYKSHDEPLVKILQSDNGILQSYSKVLGDLEKDPRNNELLIKKMNLEKSVETLKGLRDGVVARGTEISGAIKTGAASPSLNKDYINNYEKLVKDFQYDYKISDDGNIVVENKAYDPDGDGIPNELTLNDLYDPEKMKLKPSFNPKAWVVSTKEEFGKYDKTTDNGITSSRLVGFNPEKAADLLTKIDNDLGKSLETMTDAAKAYINDSLKLDYRELTESQFTDVKKDLARRTKNAYDTINKTDVDASASLDREKYNDEKGSNGISFIESNQYGASKNATAHRYSFNKPYTIKGTGKSDSPKTLYEIRYDQENGNVVLMGKEYVGKTTTKNDAKSTVNRADYASDEEFMIAAEANEKNKSTSTSSEDDWKPITISKKSEVTAILSKVMGVGSYDEIVNKLKPKGTEEKTNKPTFD